EAAAGFAAEGIATGASGRNWSGYGAEIDWPAAAPDWQRAMVSDPQTSGGLLVSCAPEAGDGGVSGFAAAGFGTAALIAHTGRRDAAAGAPRLRFGAGA